MNKKLEKGVGKALVASLAASVIAAGVPTKAAELTVDELFVQALTATKKAEADKTQENVNAARELVAQLPDKIANKQVLAVRLSKVQQELITKAYNDLKSAETEGKQAYLNSARKTILNFPAVAYRTQYLTKLSNVQDALIAEAKKAADDAFVSKKQADLEVAKALVAELATADAAPVKNWTVAYVKKNVATQNAILEAGMTAYNKAVAAGATQADKDAAKNIIAEVKANAVAANVKTWAEKMEAALTAKLAVLNVSEVSAVNNLKAFTISFNKPVDVATITTSTLKIYKNASTTLETYTQSLSADKMTLTVALGNSLAQNDALKITVDGVKTVDAKETITGFSVDKVASDVTLPTIVDVKATTSTTIDVTFSEPMNITAASKVWDEIYIDGVKTYATVATGSLDLSNKITLTLATKLSVGSHTYKITSFRDWAGFPVVTREGSIAVVADSAAPSVVSATVTKNNEVTVVFDEPVSSSSISLNSTNFEFTEAGGTRHQVTAVTNTAGDNKTYELTVGAVAGGSATFTPAAIVNVDLSYKGIADLEGNAVSTAKTYSFKASDDIARPTVSGSVNAVNNTVELTFSEKMAASVTTGTNYTLYKDGKKVATTVNVIAKTGDTTGTKYVASFSNAADLSGAYLLRINNLTDASIRANAIVADTDVAITLVDVAAPTIVDAASTKEYKDTNSPANSKADKLKVVVSYSENMDSATALNLSNYVFNFGGADIIASTLTDATAAFGADNKTVVITIPATEVNTTDVTIAGRTFTTATQAVTVKALAVKDAAGNVLKATDINRAVTLTAYNSSAATLTSVKAIASNKVELKSDVPFLSIDPNGIKFTGAITTTDVVQPVLVAGVEFSADRKTAVLTLGANLSANGQYDIDETGTTTLEGLKLVTVSDTAIVNNLGQNVAKGTWAAGTPNAFTAVGPTYAVADAIAPSLISANPVTKGGAVDVIRVTFDEALDLATADTARIAGLANDLTVTIGGTVLDVTAGDFVVIEDGANDATFGIQILKNGITATDDVTVKLNNGRYVLDAAGNTGSAFDAKTIKSGDLINELVAPTAVAYHGTTAPTSFKLVSATSITIKFSEALDAAKFVANNANGFAVTVAGTLTSTTLGTDGKTVTLTGTGFDGTTMVAYTAPGTTADIIDLAGNKLASFVATAVN